MKTRNILFRNIAIGIFLFVLLSTFLIPGLLVDQAKELNIGVISYGLSAYLLSWFAIAELLYLSAAQLYGFKNKTLPGGMIDIALFEKSLPDKLRRNLRVASVPLCLISYAFTIYCFAVAYLYLSRTDPSAFSVKEIDLFTAIYFSTVTAATVGYGDISPVSHTARLLVIIEIWLSLIYVVFFFSLLSTTIRNKD